MTPAPAPYPPIRYCSMGHAQAIDADTCSVCVTYGVTCRCYTPINDRLYLGAWACRQCGRLRRTS